MPWLSDGKSRRKVEKWAYISRLSGLPLPVEAPFFKLALLTVPSFKLAPFTIVTGGVAIV
jgi:hypothetical protein